MNRAILFECYDVAEVPNPNDPQKSLVKAYLVERWRGAVDVPN
jgi:hypothetical protein